MAQTGSEPSHSGPVDAHDLGPQLEPLLLDACRGRLTNVRWFRSDWQLGGAATAYARYDPADATTRDVVAKFPVGPREYRVLTTLAQCPAPTPRVPVHGQHLGPHDIAWVVMERLPGNPMAAHLHREVFPHLAEAAARFHQACDGRLRLDPQPPIDWRALLERSKESLRANPALPHASRWLTAVKHAAKSLPKLLAVWDARPINALCHGDLHPGNCMERPAGSPWGEPGHILFDFAQSHPGHWVEDAIYLERLYWARPHLLDGVKPVSLIAKARRSLGLDGHEDYTTLADTRRALMAATSPAFLEREGHPAYLNAALEVLERVLVQLHL
jgi:aminoglycoside phosphotransferase (APT) family kinase protein